MNMFFGEYSFKENESKKVLLILAFVIVILLLLFFCFKYFGTKDSKKEEDSIIVFNQTEISLKKGDNYQLIVDKLTDENINEMITYESSNNNVAIIDKDSGYVNALNDGVAIIYAKINGIKKERCIVSVESVDRVINELDIQGEKINLAVNKTYQLKYNVSPQNATIHNVYYESSDESVAIVDENGKITGKNAGKAVIKIHANNTSAIDSIMVEVHNVDEEKIVNSINIKNDEVYLNVSKTIILSTEISPLRDNHIVNWFSSNNKIVTVDNKGKVEAKGEGEAYIVVSSLNGKTDKVKVKVQKDSISVTSVKIVNQNVILNEGMRGKIEYEISPKLSTNQGIVFSSTDKNVLTVDQYGFLNALKEGVATVRVNTIDGNYNDEIIVNVKKNNDFVNVNEINVDSEKIELNVGKSKSIEYVITPPNATYKDVKWNSSDTNIVTVEDGMIYAKGVGKATITVMSHNNKKATLTVDVTPIKVSGISIKPEKVSLKKGETKTLNPIIEPLDATDKGIKYETSNSEAVSVDQYGIVTAKNDGVSVITVTSNDGNYLNKTVVFVGSMDNTIIPVESISLEKEKITLRQGEQKTLLATILPTEATNKSVKWSSSDSSIVTVDDTGNIKALKSGEVVITAKSSDGPSANISLKVIKVTNTTEMCDFVKSSEAKSISYEDFREFYKDQKDDYYMLRMAHQCANKLDLPIVLTEAKRYDIYHIHNTAEYGSILVQTSTNLGGSSIYIHDEEGIAFNSKDPGRVFWIRENKTKLELTDKEHNNLKNNLKGKIKVSTNAKIPELAGYGNAMIEIVDGNAQMYCRTNDVHTGCSRKKDYFIVDNNGNVANDIVWDFPNITEVNIYPIEKDTIVFENAKMYNIVDPKDYSHRTDYMYINRGIGVERSNVELKNIEHKYLNTSEKEINVMNVSYGGIITVNNAANINLTNIILSAMKSRATNNSSTYDLNLTQIVNLTLKNVTIPDNQLNDTNLWHVTGSNRTKNVVCDGCKLNGYDAHKGVHNLTIKNSVMGKDRITVVGSGTLLIDNTTFKGSNEIVQLKDGYGSTWQGTIKINNSKFYPSFKNVDGFEIPTSATRIIWFRFSADDYGYDIYLPNVQINNLVVYNNPSAIYVYPNDKYHCGCGSGDTNLKYSTYYCYQADKKNIINRKIHLPSQITFNNITDQNGNSIINKMKSYYATF